VPPLYAAPPPVIMGLPAIAPQPIVHAPVRVASTGAPKVAAPPHAVAPVVASVPPVLVPPIAPMMVAAAPPPVFLGPRLYAARVVVVRPAWRPVAYVRPVPGYYAYGYRGAYYARGPYVRSGFGGWGPRGRPGWGYGGRGWGHGRR